MIINLISNCHYVLVLHTQFLYTYSLCCFDIFANDFAVFSEGGALFCVFFFFENQIFLSMSLS